MYLLDSNICIDFMRGRAPALYTVFRGMNRNLFKIPSLVEMELMLGVEKTADSKLRAQRRAVVESFLQPFEILPYDSDCARVTATVRADLEASGERIGPTDTLIAGMALAHGAVLITNNTREFGRVKGLRLESWYDISDIWAEAGRRMNSEGRNPR